MIRFSPIVVTAAVLALLGGCAVGPNYQAPQPDLPNDFVAASDQHQAASPATEETDWWRSFQDPELTSLVQRAIAANLDFKIAVARLQEARTQGAVVAGAALPEVGVSGAAGRGNGSDLTRGRISPALASADNRNGAQITQAVGFDAEWEIDLFGKLRREIEAAGDDAQAAIEARNDALITLVADVARTYFDLRGLEMRRAALGRNIATAQRTVDFVTARFDRGLTNELDVTLAQRELAMLNAEATPMDAQITAARYTLAVLIGEYPESVDRELAKPGTIPALPASVATGLPIDLLRRRPDIREAERALAAATARIGVATADLFPHLDVTGALGWQALSASTGASPQIWALGPSASWSLLDFGTLDALVDIADLRSKEYLLAYKRTILEAVRQVDTEADDYAAEQNSLRNLDDAIAASRRSVRLASERYDRGLTDFLNVLDAERQEYVLEDQYAATQTAAAEALVGLYKGLGGGWEKYQALPPFRHPQPVVIAAFQRLFDPETSSP